MHRTQGLVFLFVAFASLASGQTTSTTRLIPYSGTALDATGQPLHGPVSLAFELYEEETGGAPLWRELQQVHADDRGRYVVYLGADTPMPQVAFTEERARWLAVHIDGRELPRVMLVAVPYALHAADADALGGQPASSFVRSRADGRLETSAGVVVAEPAVEGSGVAGQIAKFTSATTVGSSVISESASNRVGFGLTDPTGGGVVDSVFSIRNFDNNTGFGILNQTQQRRFAINTLASGGWAIYDGGGGAWNLGLSQVSGNVGIGTTNPTGAKLRTIATTTHGLYASVSAPGLAQFGVRAEVPQGSTAIAGFSSNAPPAGVAAVNGAGVWGFGEGNTDGVQGWALGTGRGIAGASPSGIGVFGGSDLWVGGRFRRRRSRHRFPVEGGRRLQDRSPT